MERSMQNAQVCSMIHDSSMWRLQTGVAPYAHLYIKCNYFDDLLITKLIVCSTFLLMIINNAHLIESCSPHLVR